MNKVNLLDEMTTVSEALLANQIAIESNNNFVAHWIRLGKLCEEQNRINDAIDSYHKALEIDPGNAEIWNRLGNIYSDSSDFNQAIPAYRKAIEADPDFGWSYSNLALAYCAKNEFEQAIELYQKSIELIRDGKDQAITWNRLGMAYRQLNDYDNAVKAFRKADELVKDQSILDNNPEQVLNNLDVFDLENEDETIQEYIDSIEDEEIQVQAESGEASKSIIPKNVPEPDEVPVHEVNVEEEEPPVAEIEPVAAADEDEQVEDAAVKPAINTENDGQEPDHAIDILEDIASDEFDTDDPQAWNDLGNVFFEAGNYTEAIKAYSKAIELDDEYGWPYSNLALTYAQTGNYAEAIDLYRKGLALFSDDEDKAITWNRLGNAHRRAGEYDNAIIAYQWADELDPENIIETIEDEIEDVISEVQSEAEELIESDELISDSAAIEEKTKKVEPLQPVEAQSNQVQTPDIVLLEDSVKPQVTSSEVEAPEKLIKVELERIEPESAVLTEEEEDLADTLPHETVAVEEVNKPLETPIVAEAVNQDLSDVQEAAPEEANTNVKMEPDTSEIICETEQDSEEVSGCAYDFEQAQIWNALGEGYFKAGEYSEAIEAFQKAIRLDKEFGLPYSNLALTYTQKGMFTEAINLYQESLVYLENDQDRITTFIRTGDAYRRLGDYVSALEAYQNADELNPEIITDGNSENIRDVISEPEIQDEADALAPEAVEVDDTETEFEEMVASVEVEATTEEAMEIEETAPVLNNPQMDDEIQVDTAEHESKEDTIPTTPAEEISASVEVEATVTENETESVPEPQDAAVNEPVFPTDNVYVWFELGNVYFNSGSYDDAIGAYQKAIKLNPNFGWAYSNLGLAYTHKGLYSEAIPMYQMGLEFLKDVKDQAETLNRLGNAYRRINDYDNAVAAYQQADKLDKDHALLLTRARFSLLSNCQVS
ncbi:MAG: tetratricopeptide repeat protein [Anaerolineales bacterium]|nr:tetratricopeptide repeat protein [Anaerolineales bacterium]